MGISDGARVDEYGNEIVTTSPFSDANGFRARFKGVSGTATKNTTTNIDYKLTQERHINGIELILTDHVEGDKLDFQVVDVDNILGYGAGTVLDSFGESWYVDETISSQNPVVVPYPAKIIANLYIRIKYYSVGTTNDVKVKANLHLHWKSA